MNNQPSPYAQAGTPDAMPINQNQKLCPVDFMLFQVKISVNLVPKIATLLTSIPSPNTFVKSISQPRILIILVLSGVFWAIEILNFSILFALNLMRIVFESPWLHS